jgi:hypothetical protein
MPWTPPTKTLLFVGEGDSIIVCRRESQRTARAGLSAAA